MRLLILILSVSSPVFTGCAQNGGSYLDTDNADTGWVEFDASEQEYAAQDDELNSTQDESARQVGVLPTNPTGSDRPLFQEEDPFRDAVSEEPIDPMNP